MHLVYLAPPPLAGTKNEMDRLESLYIQGNYTPSACDDVPEAANSDLPGKSPCPQEKESRKGKCKNV